MSLKYVYVKRNDSLQSKIEVRMLLTKEEKKGKKREILDKIG